MLYADFKYYKETYKGTLTEDSFDSLILKASREIDKNINTRLTERKINNLPSEAQDQLKYTACALTDLINKKEEVNNGAHFENFVAQQLTANGYEPYFCKKKNIGEIDFVIEMNGKVVPIEVKSGNSYKTHKALDNFMDVPDYHLEIAYILSTGNVETEGNVIYLPIYMCYLLKEKKIGQMIVDLDITGL